MTHGTAVCHRGHWRCVDADGDVDVAVEDVCADVGFVRVHVFVLKFLLSCFWVIVENLLLFIESLDTFGLIYYENLAGTKGFCLKLLYRGLGDMKWPPF